MANTEEAGLRGGRPAAGARIGYSEFEEQATTGVQEKTRHMSQHAGQLYKAYQSAEWHVADVCQRHGGSKVRRVQGK
jgi:hypothetical protein